jgi:hypothetical protein
VGLLIAVCAPGVASAEICTQSGTSAAIAGCQFVGGNVTGCTPDCSDSFVIDGTVVQVADFAMTDPSGDSLIIRTGSWNANGFDLAYDEGGLFVSPAGSFSMQGPGFREWTGNAFATTQSAPSPWPLSSIVLCPDANGAPDCNGSDNNIVRIAYDPQRGDADVPASLAAVRPGDVLCGYYDPETMGATVAASWSNSCFEISAIAGTCQSIADCHIDIELDQSWYGQASRDFPLPRRRVVESALRGTLSGTIAFPGAATSAVVEGRRRFCLDGETPTAIAAIEKNEDLVGRFLRFAEPTSLPMDWSYVINALEYRAAACDALPACNGDCHLVTIADPHGVRETHAAGERVWIDPGFLSTDAFAILADPPVLSGGHAPGNLGGQFHVQGNLTLRNLVAADVGTFKLFGATIDALEWLFVSDPTPNGNAIYDTQLYVFQLIDNVMNTDAIHHINVVGGPGFATCDNLANTGPGSGTDSCNSGLHVFMMSGQPYRLHDISISHNEDDCISGLQPGGGLIEIERLYCGATGDEPSSSNFIDLFDLGNHVLHAQDIICTNCSNESGPQSVAIFKLPVPTAPVTTLNRVSVIGAQGPFNQPLASEAAQFTNLYLSGHRTANDGTGPANAEHFVIEDTRPDSDLPLSTRAYWPAETVSRLKNGIVRNSVLSGAEAVLEHPDEGKVDNVLFLNLDKSSAGSGSNAFVDLRVDPTGPQGSYRNITIAYQDGVEPVHLDSILDASDLNGTAYVFEDVLIANTPDAVAMGIEADDINALTSGGWCLFDAGAIEDAENFPADSVWDQDPGFTNPETDDYRTHYGGPCGVSGIRRGVDKPGLEQHGYYLSALHLSPKRLNRIEGVAWPFTGTATGGSIEFTADGVDFHVSLAPGASAVDVAGLLAAAINANAELAAQQVVAFSINGVLVTNALVYDAEVNDAGLSSGPTALVSLRMAGLASLAALLAACAFARLWPRP